MSYCNGLTMILAEHIVSKDWDYFIRRTKILSSPKNNQYSGRRRNIVNVCGLFEILLRDGQDGKPDRTGASGYSVWSNDFRSKDVPSEIVDHEGSKFLQRKDSETIILYLIKDGGQ